MKTNKEFMHRAIELARKGLGKTWPNPPVGAVVVKNKKIVGAGYHRKAGGSHAEVVALRKAGRRAQGASLYVTLEPCCHFGRTPPCVDAITRAKVKHVFFGTRDPHPMVRGKGIARLKKNGVQVTNHVLGETCRELIHFFEHRVRTGVPFVTCKVALTLDGKIARADGTSKWITGSSCRRYVHHLRNQYDAIVVGSGTVHEDNPRLTVRLDGKVRVGPVVVIDSTLRALSASRLWNRKPGTLFIATTARASRKKIQEAQKRGHIVFYCRATSDGRVFLPHLLHQLGDYGFTSLFVEGGGRLFSDFFSRGLVNRLVACIAPKIFGASGKDFLAQSDAQHMLSLPQLQHPFVQTFGNDIVIEGEVHSRVYRNH